MPQTDILKHAPEAMLAMPLLAAAITALFLRKSKWGGAALSIFSATAVLALSLYLLVCGRFGEIAPRGFEIFSLGGLSVKFGFLADALAANMVFVVAFVGWLIHIFSVGYMNHDPAKGRFFGGLSFFMFSMTGIMLADNLFMMFVFWEFVGFSSYMLIAHYADTEYSKMASKKAFIANRIGDFGFLLGIIFCYWTFGSTNFSEIAEALKINPQLASTGMALLLICGFLGKSAQFPLQVWLTDAMAGPTPVSALIHAATMVAAGVFMTARLGVVGLLTPAASAFMLFICALMAMCAGFWALGQSDIKKTLAYSTLAHLGLMGVAVGMGAYGIAMMHLTMHAFFKAGLFLTAGAVIYACNHEQDMFKMGGLWKKMPITALCAAVFTCSIISVPYFAGYYSKEMILNISFVNAFGAEGSGAFLKAVFAMVLVAALLTPVYMGRLLWSVFFAKPASEKSANAREVSLWMLLPLAVLAVYSLGGAWGAVFEGRR
ncbi:MAG: NADH-quinone oxidoreductase subunit L, partial [Opitutales bacterium]|nr:NADH-quinone oxidoreductase subunit L [Opitutales bacterium]